MSIQTSTKAGVGGSTRHVSGGNTGRVSVCLLRLKVSVAVLRRDELPCSQVPAGLEQDAHTG